MIIQSLFDNDLYKFTMQQAVVKLYPDAEADLRFINRGKQRFNDKFLANLRSAIDDMGELRATDDELEKMSSLPFVQPWYVDYLSNYRYDPRNVQTRLDHDKNLGMRIAGKWRNEIMWEVPLMACISHCYFELEDGWSMDGQEEKLRLKVNKLAVAQCKYADFGTRRRRNFDIQEMVVKGFKRYHGFVGTSNVHLAFKHDVKPIGTMAHEWIQGISALESLNHANKVMLKRWLDVYDSDLGIALTDTFGSDAFFKEFRMRYAKLFDGVRHDSGDPFNFADKVVAHYRSVRVNPAHKTIVFSNALDADLAVQIKAYCDKIGINCSFGIGTTFTNDFQTPALNMVIKLWAMNGFNVAKLSDEPGKASGDPEAVANMRYIYQAAA